MCWVWGTLVPMALPWRRSRSIPYTVFSLLARQSHHWSILSLGLVFSVWLLPETVSPSREMGCSRPSPQHRAHNRQTLNQCRPVTWVGIQEDNSARTSGRNRLEPQAEDTETRGATHSAPDRRRPARPGRRAQPCPRGPEPDAPGTAREGTCRLPPKTHATRGQAQHGLGGSRGVLGQRPEPRPRGLEPQPGPRPPPRARAAPRREIGRTGGGRAHPVLRLQLRQPLLPQGLQLLLRHGAAVGAEQPTTPRRPTPRSPLQPGLANAALLTTQARPQLPGITNPARSRAV